MNYTHLDQVEEPFTVTRAMQDWMRHVMHEGCPLGEARSGRCVLSASDVQHSRLAGKATGNVMKRSAYDPYGNIGGLTSSIGYTGQRREPLLGGYSLGHGKRVYQPRIMRFMTPDSYSPFHEGGINPYMYCKGDPVNKTDPSGHKPSTAKYFALAAALVALVVTLTICGGPALSSISLASAITSVMDVASIGFLITSFKSPTSEEEEMYAWISLGVSLATMLIPPMRLLAMGRAFRANRLLLTSEGIQSELAAAIRSAPNSPAAVSRSASIRGVEGIAERSVALETRMASAVEPVSEAVAPAGPSTAQAEVRATAQRAMPSRQVTGEASHLQQAQAQIFELDASNLQASIREGRASRTRIGREGGPVHRTSFGHRGGVNRYRSSTTQNLTSPDEVHGLYERTTEL